MHTQNKTQRKKSKLKKIESKKTQEKNKQKGIINKLNFISNGKWKKKERKKQRVKVTTKLIQKKKTTKQNAKHFLFYSVSTHVSFLATKHQSLNQLIYLLSFYGHSK